MNRGGLKTAAHYKEIKMVTEQQKQKMQHMLGFHNGKAPKAIWRNYWFGQDEDLESLIAEKKVIKAMSGVSKDPVYFLMPSGIDEIMGKSWSLKHKTELIRNEVLAEWAFGEK